jgi:hypothetical protein
VLACVVGLGEGYWKFRKLAVSLVAESKLAQLVGRSWVFRDTVFPARSGTAAAAEVVASTYAVAADAVMVDRATTADAAAWSTGVAADTVSVTDAAVTEAADVAANAAVATDTAPADIISHRNRATKACRDDALGGSLMVLLTAR